MTVIDGNGWSPDGQQSGESPGASRRLPRRFYETAGISAGNGGFVVHLDGRPVKTPLTNLLIVPAKPLAVNIAKEWQNQGAHIDPQSMPLTKLANAALDHVAGKAELIINDIVSFAASDLTCYRAEQPDPLVTAQKKHWDPVLDWCAEFLGARFLVTEGIVHVSQPKAALDTFRAAVAALDSFRLIAFHAITALTGSALLALALSKGRLGAEEAWRAAHVDEDFQISKWGRDADAEARREKRWVELSQAHEFDRLAATD